MQNPDGQHGSRGVKGIREASPTCRRGISSNAGGQRPRAESRVLAPGPDGHPGGPASEGGG